MGQTQTSSSNDAAPIASSPTTAPTTDDAADVSAASTLPYNDDDPDRTLPYEDEAPAEAADKQQFEDLFSMSRGDLHSIAAQCRMIVKDKSHLQSYLKDIEEFEASSEDMYAELHEEFTALLEPNSTQFWVHLVTGDVFRIQDETGELSLADMANYGQLVLDADRRELKQFIDYGVWKKRHLSRLPDKVNLVDCT